MSAFVEFLCEGSDCLLVGCHAVVITGEVNVAAAILDDVVEVVLLCFCHIPMTTKVW